MSSRRERLLDLAEALLEREGLEGFGVSALAREAGVKPPSLYKHFSGAEEIEHALVARWLRRLAEHLEAAERRAGDAEGLASLGVAYRGLAAASPQLYRLAAERPIDRALLERLDEGSEASAMAAVLRFFGQHEDRRARARLAWAAAHGLVSLELAGRFPPDADLEAAWRLLSTAMTA